MGGLWGDPKPGTRPTRDSRRTRSEELRVSSLESLENRTLPSGSSFDAFNQGIFGYATNGDWVSLRYDGEAFVSETALDLNSAGRSSDPLTADLDGDGRVEFYIHNNFTGEWQSIQPENIQEPLKIVSKWTAIEPLKAALVGDINGDGHDDIVTLNAKGNWYSLSWNGVQYVTSLVYGWYRSENWNGLQLVDFDGDGVKEIAGFDSTTGNWYSISRSGGAYRNQLIATWNRSLDYSSFFTADLNGDHLQEIIARDSSGNWWELNLGSTGFQTLFLGFWGVSGGWRAFTVADLNGDGRDEIIGQEMATGSWWSISQEGVGFVSRWQGGSTPGLKFEYMLVGDVTGDGRSDIVSRDLLGNFWALSSNGTTTQLILIKTWTTNETWRDVKLIDYDGDGTFELIARNDSIGSWWGINGTREGYTNEFLALWGTTGNYSFAEGMTINSAGAVGLIGWDSYGDWWLTTLGETSLNRKLTNLEPPFRYSKIYTAELNRDGSPDLVGFDESSGTWWGIVHDLNGTQINYLGRWDSEKSWQNQLFTDLNGDGLTDIASFNPASGSWWGILSSGGNYYSQGLSTWNPASKYRDISVLDLNGDGRSEIVGRDDTGSWWSVTSVDGVSFFNQFLQGWNENWNWRNIVSVDLEGDDKQELIGQTLRGEWWELYWTGTSYASRKLAGWNGSETYRDILIGDINGDGRQDLVARSENGNWWMLSYSGSGVWSTRFLTGWTPGNGWKNLVIADLNGDHRGELVGQDASNANWWGIFWNGTGYENRQLVEGSQGIQTSSVGTVDFDLDGTMELVGRDPNRGNWWTLSYSNTRGTVVRDLGNAGIQGVAVGAIPGVSDAAFKQFLLKEIPTLSLSLGSDRLKAARLLMNWSSRNADAAISALLESQTRLRVNATSRPSDMYRDFFLPSRGGVFCGGFSIFLNNILRMFGYDSFTLNFGDLRDDLTHVVVIVPLQNSSGDWDYYVFDPTFNTLFLEPGTNRMLTFGEMVRKIRSGQSQQILIRQDPFTDREWLSFNQQANTQYQLKSGPTGENGGLYIYTRPNYTLTSWLYEMRSLLARYGYSTGTTGYLQLLTNQIFSVGQSPNAKARDRFIEVAIAAGIKM